MPIYTTKQLDPDAFTVTIQDGREFVAISDATAQMIYDAVSLKKFSPPPFSVGAVYAIALLLISSCVGIADDEINVSQEQEELRYSCGMEGGCYCCYDNDAYGGCCMCPTTGARCR